MYRRGKIWYFCIDGVRESSGTSDKKRAEALERKRRQEAWDRSNGYYIKTWDEACLEWLQSHQHIEGYQRNCGYAAWWTPHLTGLKVNLITRELVDRISRLRPVNEKEATKQNTTANQYVQFVSKILRSAGVVPPKFRLYPKKRGGKRWLKQGEWEALIPQMPDDLRHVCTFALATGLREANVMRFEWGWIHGTAAYLPASVTKTEQDYGIPLNSVSQAIIAERRKATVRHPVYVFTENGKPWYKLKLLRRLYKAVQAAGIAPMTFHTFRHTFASWLAQKGVDGAIRKRLGCWTIGGSAADGYVHFDVESLRPFSELVLSPDSHSGNRTVENVA